MNKNYYIETYGCQMNVYDSELVAGQLHKLGYNKTQELNQADIILLNTCSIREKAEETVHNRLDSLHYLKKNKVKKYQDDNFNAALNHASRLTGSNLTHLIHKLEEIKEEKNERDVV